MKSIFNRLWILTVIFPYSKDIDIDAEFTDRKQF